MTRVARVTRRIRTAVGLLGVLALVVVLAGCGSRAGERTTLTVYAASSLAAVFEQLGDEFEADHPGVEVTFSFAGSSDLVAQIEQGAPADVVATADLATMSGLAGLLDGEPVHFATNELVIATPAGNPARITGVEDLARDDVRLVVCAPQVPCGFGARSIEEAAGLDWAPVSEEPSVADVIGKVRSGEADAGIVYVTDVRAAGNDVRGISLDYGLHNLYPIAAVAGGDEDDLARAFIQLVTGEVGQRVLADAGFGHP